MTRMREARAENVVNGVKTIMVNEPLRAGAARVASPDAAMLRRGPGRNGPSSLEPDMANPKPLMAKSSGTDPADAAIQSALRTLDAEASGDRRDRGGAAIRSRARPLPPPST